MAHSTPTKSWLNIVVGEKTSKDKLVQPAKKGSLLSKCRGELLVMLGHYGWIKPLQPIDHPDVEKHGGRIYIKKCDFRPRSEPLAGDEVVFCLYADHDGLGAEDCYVVGEVQPSDLQQDECQWVNTQVEIDHDDQDKYQRCEDKWMNPHAQEFVPSWVSTLPPFEIPCVQTNSHKIPSAFNTSYFLDFLDDSDSEDESEAGFNCKFGNQDDSSTTAGNSSDGESEMYGFKMGAWLQAPPGLELPARQLQGLEAPPGLEHIQSMEAPPGLGLLSVA